jgi:eukaryotic-like serine/threonine-protein kinase
MPNRKWSIGTQVCAHTSWASLRRELASDLRSLAKQPDRIIFIALSNGRFVQFISQRDGSMTGETSGYEQLSTQNGMTPATCQRLLRIGWHPPGSDSGAPFFSRCWKSPVPVHEVVSVAIETLTSAFGAATPEGLIIRYDSFDPTSCTWSDGSVGWIQPTEDPALRLRAGTLVRNAASGREYRVARPLSSGGFGAVYTVRQVGGPPLTGEFVLKVAAGPIGWHREAYFADLLRHEAGIVKIHEFFACLPRRNYRKPLYCLISDRIEGGDLACYFEGNPAPWAEKKARREIISLLRAVVLLHSAGAVHRDITPRNVFVTGDGALKLADFGIATHRIGKRQVPADTFNRWFASTAMRDGKIGFWRPSDDIYHVGQLYATLLAGEVKARFTSKDVRDLDCSPGAKAIIQRCIGPRRKRFASALEMLAAIEAHEPLPAKATVRSLAGKRVVFTGRLPILRTDAKRLVADCGGIPEDRISSKTTVLVVGDRARDWKAVAKGQKLLDVDREWEIGHHIAVITGNRFLALTTSRSQ